MDVPSLHPECRSDLTGAKIEGADFSNALVDKTQQIVRLAPALTHRLCCLCAVLDGHYVNIPWLLCTSDLPDCALSLTAV